MFNGRFPDLRAVKICMSSSSSDDNAVSCPSLGSDSGIGSLAGLRTVLCLSGEEAVGMKSV